MNFIISAVFLMLYGFCSACKDGCLWQGDNYIIKRWEGSNPKYFFLSDTWHFFKHMEQFCMYSAIYWASGLSWYYWPIILVIGSLITGRAFVLFYHTLLLKKPDQSVWQWVKGTFLIGNNK